MTKKNVAVLPLDGLQLKVNSSMVVLNFEIIFASISIFICHGLWQERMLPEIAGEMPADGERDVLPLANLADATTTSLVRQFGKASDVPCLRVPRPDQAGAGSDVGPLPEVQRG